MSADDELHAARERLRRLLRELSVRTGDFVLASGRRSSFYVDAKMTTLHPEGAELVGRLCFARLRGRGFRAVGGLSLGADPIAVAVVLASRAAGEPLAAFLVRKTAKGHGSGKRVEGHLPRDALVAVVEDVTTTGSSALEAVAAVEAAGARVGLVLSLVDRQEGGAENLRGRGIPFAALFTRAELLEGEIPSR